jgi:hypothetical protein
LLDALLCQLAFKDPNTGLYSQQRVEVQNSAALLGEGKTPADLRALISEGFLGSVDYMFWDDEDPSRVTLKVSHESFIRGWLRFRKLIDGESERFEHFVGLLRKCADWETNQKSDKFLVDEGDLSRVKDNDLVARLAQPQRRENWFRLLQVDRDGARLAKLGPQLDAYLSSSQRALDNREKRVKNLSWSRRAFVALTLVLLPAAAYSVFIQDPVMKRVLLLFDANALADRAPLTPEYAGVGAAAGPLDSLLRAAATLDDARTGGNNAMARLSEWLLNHFAWLPPVRRQDQLLTRQLAQAEPSVNGRLRQVLTDAVWRTEPPRQASELMEAPLVLDDKSCAPGAEEDPASAALSGRLFVAATRLQGGPRRRAIFAPVLEASSETGIALRVATYDVGNKTCEYGAVAFSVPRRLQPKLVMDAGLRYYAYTAQGPNVDVPSVTVQEFDWERVDENKRRIVQYQTRAVITETQVVERVRQAAGSNTVATVDSWRVLGGRGLMVAGQPWRLVSPTAVRLPADTATEGFVDLVPANANSVCETMNKGWQTEPGFRTQMFESVNHCFAVKRGNRAPEGAADKAAAATDREQAFVAVYDKPEAEDLPRLKDNPPVPLASLSPFARVPTDSAQWQVGTRGDFAGWLALRSKDAAGKDGLVAVPWSTCALWRFGKQLQQHNAISTGLALVAQESLPPESRSAVCQDR